MNKNITSIFFITIVIILILYKCVPPYSKLFGKNIWYKNKKFVNFSLDGKQTSQQLFDIYSFSHITHGILFYFILKKLGFENNKSLYITIFLEIAWEIFENTPFIINKYRKNKHYKNYRGDTIINIIGDTLSTVLGFYISHNSTPLAVIFIIISEIILLNCNASLFETSIGHLL